MTRTRVFYKGKLIFWSQRRCIICQRFLSKHQNKYCSVCDDIVTIKRSSDWITNHPNNKKINDSIYREKNKEQRNLRNFIYYHADNFNIGDLI